MSGEVFITHPRYEERETVFVAWIKSRKHWGERSDPNAETHAAFKNMPLARSYEVVDYES